MFYYFFSSLYLNKIKVHSFSWCNLTGQKITRNKKKTAQYYFVVDVCLCSQTMVFVISKPESRGGSGFHFSRRCRRCHSCCLFSIKNPSRKKVSWSRLQKPWINFYIREGENSFWLFLTVCQQNKELLRRSDWQVCNRFTAIWSKQMVSLKLIPVFMRRFW